jgi:ribulose-bisphosphate carboxylase large chain
MIDILTVGWSALQGIRNLNKKLVIHAHRAGHAMITRNPKHGMSMLAIAKCARLVGVDQLHIGAVVGKMEGGASEITEIEHEIVKESAVSRNALRQNWYGLKPVLPVCSGGLHPGHVPELVKIMGKDIVIQMGGGIHWNPKGTFRGARGARQAVEAVIKGKNLEDYAKQPCHAELKEAIEKFGVKK